MNKGIILCLLALIYACKTEVSDWHKVIVVSRVEVITPYSAFASETEVTLRFSDKTCWSGTPSRAKASESFLLKSQPGDTVYYRYNSLYFTGKEWTK